MADDGLNKVAEKPQYSFYGSLVTIRTTTLNVHEISVFLNIVLACVSGDYHRKYN